MWLEFNIQSWQEKKISGRFEEVHKIFCFVHSPVSLSYLIILVSLGLICKSP